MLRDEPSRASWALGEIGPAARAAVPDLLKLLTVKEGEMHIAVYAALGALGKIGTDSQDAVAAVTTLAGSEDPLISTAAKKALILMGNEGKKARLASAIRELADPHEDARLRAVQDLCSLGETAAPAIPALIAALEDESVRRMIPDVLGAIGKGARSAKPDLVDTLQDDEWLVRLNALDALVKVGADPRIAVPAILPLLNDENEDVRFKAIIALGEFGPAAGQSRPALIAAMQAPNVSVRLNAAKSLGKIGPRNEVEPALRLALSDRDVRVKEAAEEALGLRGPETVDEEPEKGVEPMRADLPTLIRTLNEGGLDARRAAAGLIKLCRESFKVGGASYMPGPWTRECSTTEFAPPEGALNNPDILVRRVAVEAMAALGPKAKSAVPAVTSAFTDSDPIVRGTAAEALGLIGPAAAPAVPALMVELRKRPHDQLLLMAFGGIGEAANPAAPLLASVFRNKEMDAWARECALSSLVQVAPHDRDTQLALDEASRDPGQMPRVIAAAHGTSPAALTAALHDQDEVVRYTAMDSFLRVTADEKLALAVYIPALKDSSGNVRQIAATGLDKLGLSARPAMRQLIEAVADRDTGDAAARALGNFGAEAADAVPALTTALHSQRTRRAAAETLGKIGPLAAEAAPALAECLTSQFDREICAEALGRIGPDAKRAAPALVKLLTTTDWPWDRRSAATALGDIGVANDEVLRALQAATRDEYPEVQQAAATALGKLSGAGR
jgi:HEAT repeat protein